MAKVKVRNIGLGVPAPKTACNDKHCPFHGNLPVRGRLITGTVVSDKMDKTVVIERNYLFYVKKYERYERRRSKISAHAPPCLDIKMGDEVKIAECRPLSKTVSFVVIQKLT